MGNEKAKRLKPNEIIKPGIFTIIDSMPACPHCYSVHIQAEVVKHGPKKTNAVHFTCKTCYCEWIVAPEDDSLLWERIARAGVDPKTDPEPTPEMTDDQFANLYMEFMLKEMANAAFPRPTKEQIFFMAVKGKKIRWTHKCWIENDRWFIPETLTHNGEMRGVDENGQEQFHSVSTGFGEGGKYYWEYYPEEKPEEKTFQQRFFDTVKGKKIFWTGWKKSGSKGPGWFVPEKLEDNWLHGKNSFGNDDSYSVFYGFEHSGDKLKWEFYQEPNAEAEKEDWLVTYLAGEICKIINGVSPIKADPGSIYYQNKACEILDVLRTIG